MEKKRKKYEKATDDQKDKILFVVIELYLQGRTSEIEGSLDDIFEVFDEAERIYKNRS